MSTFNTIDVDREAQLTEVLCWAAVSTMAVRAFKASGLRQFSQMQILFLQDLGITTQKKFDDQEADFDALDAAPPAVSAFSVTGDPVLFDIASTLVPEGRVLREEVFALDIVNRSRPIIIEWDYSHDTRPIQNRPTGLHFLIVTGYNDADPDNKRLRVFDPWPALAAGETIQDLEQREKWISYDEYVTPGSDHGLEAFHAGDIYKMRRKGKTAPKGYPLTIKPPPRSAPQPAVAVECAQGVDGAQHLIEAQLPRRVARRKDGSNIAGPLAAARAIPIVAIRTKDLLRSREGPQKLLQNRTATLLVPVLSGRRVVDSFLLLNSKRGWRVGGYSNNRIAQLLVDMRERLAGDAILEREFYMVSLPEQGAFFLGHGFDDRSRLVSLNYGGQGELAPGERLLRDLVTEIDARKSRRGVGRKPRPPGNASAK